MQRAMSTLCMNALSFSTSKMYTTNHSFDVFAKHEHASVFSLARFASLGVLRTSSLNSRLCQSTGRKHYTFYEYKCRANYLCFQLLDKTLGTLEL